MRPLLFLLFLLFLISCDNNSTPSTVENNTAITEVSPTLQNGDIIFQTSLSSQSQAIQLATQSPYSHMGIIYEKDGAYFVFEAIKTVRLTPLKQWINRGEDDKYVVKRLKDAAQVLSPTVLKKMQKAGQAFQGKSYDLYFGWSDEKLYCSELVWKIYKEATDIEIGQLAQLKDFDLSHPIVQQKLHKRYGDHLPLEEKVISPAAMFESELLVTVPHQ